MVELVMVVTIIGIIAAIAVPRVSNAASGASANSMQATLTAVRKAIDCYYAEHGYFPGKNPVSGLPDGTMFVRQLLEYTDVAGRNNATYAAPYLYGPYLRAPFPANPTNKLNTVHVKATPLDANPGDGTVGWVAILSTGDFGISATDTQLEDVGIKDLDVRAIIRLDQ